MSAETGPVDPGRRAGAERGPVDPGRQAGAPSRIRRWFTRRGRGRLLLPFALVVALIAFSVTMVSMTRADPADPAYLSPVSSEPTGASKLAAMLAGRGVGVQRETRPEQALAAAASAHDAVLFVPTPQLVDKSQLTSLRRLPSSVTAVLVAPDATVLGDWNLPARVEHSRLTARTLAPDCQQQGQLPSTGSAALDRLRYSHMSNGAGPSCYRGSLLALAAPLGTVVLAGADDPFRNDRIAEHDNAAVAVALLATGTTVIWLDQHQRQPASSPANSPSPSRPSPTASPSPSATPSASPSPSRSRAAVSPSGSPTADSDSEGDGGFGGSGSHNPIWKAFPNWVYPLVALFLLAIVAMMFASGRRLGRLVNEPLPVSVRSTETVEGRGRLYHRASARQPATAELRRTARAKLVELLRLPAEVDDAQVAEAVAERTGRSRDEVEAVLFGPPPEDDAAMAMTAMSIQALLEAARSTPPPAPTEGERGE